MDYHLSSKTGRNGGTSVLHLGKGGLEKDYINLDNKKIFLLIERFSHYFLNSPLTLKKFQKQISRNFEKNRIEI